MKVDCDMDKRMESAKISSDLLEYCETDSDLRLKETAFTRQRKLGPQRLLLILLHRLAACLQLAIDTYFKSVKEEPVSKQAFSKARAGLNPEFVRKFADGIASVHARDEDAPSYRGMRLIAIDGTDIALENSQELKEAFGCSGPKKNAATALGSLAYGPLDHAVYDCQIAPYATDERDLAKLHMDRLKELGLDGSLLLLDRWYPSKQFLAHTMDAGFSFVMRVRRKWNLDVDAVDGDGWVTLCQDGRALRIRAIKVALSSGEIETLLTNLTEEQLPATEAGQLYFKRWGIETAFDTLKSKLQLENFSSKTEVGVKQDFYATVYLMGFAEICAAEATRSIETADQGKNLKYRRKANLNRAINALRNDFWRILLEKDPQVRHDLFDQLCQDIARFPEPVRPDRSPERSSPRNKRFPITKKSVLP